MIQALVACVDEKYPDSTHDITPLLDRLAEENGCDRGSLTRAQIREHATLALGKTYALDPSHSAEKSAHPFGDCRWERREKFLLS